MTPELKQRLATFDAQLIELAKPILVLKHLNWPDEVEAEFINAWRAGAPVLPAPRLAPAAAADWGRRASADHSGERAGLAPR